MTAQDIPFTQTRWSLAELSAGDGQAIEHAFQELDQQVTAFEAREKAEPYSIAHCCLPAAWRYCVVPAGSSTAVRSIAQWPPPAGPRPMPVLAGIDWRVPGPTRPHSVKNFVRT